MNASIRDIARISGVPKSTVARVMNNDIAVKPATKKKVFKTLKRLEYIKGSAGPEPLAKTIGFMIPTIEDEMDPFAVRGIAAAQAFVDGTDYSCTIFSQTTLESICQDPVKGRAKLKCDGMVLFCPYGKWERYIKILRSWGLPVVLIRRKTEVEGITTIHDNDYKGARLAIGHLHKLGHRSIAFVSRRMNQDVIGRLDGYTDYVEENGLVADKELIYDYTREGYQDFLAQAERVRSWIKNIIASDLKPSAFFGFDDAVAKWLIYYLMDLGYKVPGDFAVVGYDNDGGRDIISQTLTTVNIPVREMVELAFKSILDSFGGSKVEKADLEVANELIVRRSCGSI